MTTQSVSLWGSGPWGGGGNSWGGSTTQLHYYALKKIFPIKDLQGSQDDDLKIDGKYLDQVYYQIDELLANLFPDTATTDYSVKDFERIFNVTSQAAVLVAEKALINKNGKMNPVFFINLGISYGYTDVTVHENITDQFRIGISQLPHAIYSISNNWTWTIRSTMIPAGNNRIIWESTIEKYAPAFSKIVFQYT